MVQGKWLKGLGAGLVIVLASAAALAASEIGPPRALSPDELIREAQENVEIGDFIARHGKPDWAEAQRVAVDRPLDPYEVRLYYLDEGIVASFTRARLVGGLEVSMRKWERPLSREKQQLIVAELVGFDPAVRAEVAAGRAEMAAERVERAADAAEVAADAAASLVAAMEAKTGSSEGQR